MKFLVLNDFKHMSGHDVRDECVIRMCTVTLQYQDILSEFPIMSYESRLDTLCEGWIKRRK